MPDSPTVTVMINTYNYGRFIGRTIESVLGQEYTGQEPEILVVDDGSTDNTAKEVRRYGNRVRYLPKENGGQASALNVGFRTAHGDVVCLLDGDDYFYPHKVQRVADAFSRAEVGLVYNLFEIVDGTGRSLGKVYPETTWTGLHIPLAKVPGQIRQLTLLGHPWTCVTSAMSIRRSVMANLMVPEDVFLHSPDLFLGLVLPFLTQVEIVDSVETAYVYHGDNVGLFRSSEVNRAIYHRQMECIRRQVEERFDVCFLNYLGRSIYGQGDEREMGMERLAQYVGECRRIIAADVEPAVRRACLTKLTASLILPDAAYARLRDLRVRSRERRNQEGRS